MWCLLVVLLIWWGGYCVVSFGCFVNTVGVIVWGLLVVLLIRWGLLCGVFCEVCEALSGFLKGEGRLYCVCFSLCVCM